MQYRQFTKRAKIFYGIAIVFFIWFLIMLVHTRGQALLDVFYRAPKDTFFDFTTSVMDCKFWGQTGSMYPPVAIIFFFIVAHLMPGSYYEYGFKEYAVSRLGEMYILLFTMACIILMFWVMEHILEFEKKYTRTLLVLLVMSAPFLYEMQRGNILLLCVPLVLFFVKYYDSDKLWLRVLAIIAIGLAAGIKIYPIMLGFMIVKDKRWKQLGICVILGLLAVGAVVVMMGGFSFITTMFERLSNTSAFFNDRGFGHQLSLSNWVGLLNAGLGLELNVKAVTIAVYGLMVVGFIFSKKRWQQLALLTAPMIMVPSISFVYTMVFMVVPLCYFLIDDEDFCWMDWVYALLLAGCFVIIPFGGSNAFAFTEDQYYHLNITTVVENVCLNGMVICISIESIVGFVMSLATKAKSKK